MERYINPERNTWKSLTQRASATYDSLEPLAKAIFNKIEKDGDLAIKGYTLEFDKVQLESNLVSPDEISNAAQRVPENLKIAIQKAKNNIELFHQAQATETVQVETQPGVTCWQKKLPIEKVGLYIPAGSAPLFSTVLMLAIPARIAGCNEIVLCSPPSIKGVLSDVILYAANLCGVDYIFKVGGMQAIAGMTLGTESIPKVDKIFGPGNQFVTVAKQLATKYQVAIDMPAGPSELMVVADQTGNPDVTTYSSVDITDPGVFTASVTAAVAALTANGAKGCLTTVPYVTSLPFFTTVPYNPVPLDAATAGSLNTAFAEYNGGLQLAGSFGLITPEEIAARTIVFAAGANAVTLEDEDLTDLSSLGLPNYRQATPDDLLVLPSSSTQTVVCFIHFASSRSGKSSRACAPRDSSRLSQQCMDATD